MKNSLLSLWLGGALLGLISATTQAESLTLPQTLAAAWHYSAGLSASHNEARALQSMAYSARELPDPQLKFGLENLPVQGSNHRRVTREGMTMQRVGVMQRYVSREKRERKALTLEAQAHSVTAQSAVIQAALQRDAAGAWLELALSEKALATARRAVAETARQQPAQTVSVSSGSAMPDSVPELQLTLSALRDEVTQAGLDVQLARARLLQLTGEDVTAIAGALPPYQRLPADENTLRDGIVLHPEIIAAARETDIAKSRSAQSAIAAIPDVDVEIYYAHRAEGYDDMAGVMFTVDLPLFQSRRQDNDHAADVSLAMQANDRMAQITREHTAELSALIARYHAAQTLWLRQRDEVVPVQQRRLNLLMAQYRAGRSTLSSVLGARRDLLTSELAATKAEKELARSWAAIRWLIPQEITQ